MHRLNGKGQTWKQHVAPYLKKALLDASRKWIVPKVKEALCKKLGVCIEKRNGYNVEIKKLRQQGAQTKKGR